MFPLLFASLTAKSISTWHTKCKDHSNFVIAFWWQAGGPACANDAFLIGHSTIALIRASVEGDGRGVRANPSSPPSPLGAVMESDTVIVCGAPPCSDEGVTSA